MEVQVEVIDLSNRQAVPDLERPFRGVPAQATGNTRRQSAPVNVIPLPMSVPGDGLVWALLALASLAVVLWSLWI